MGIIWIFIAVLLLAIFGWAMKKYRNSAKSFAFHIGNGFTSSLYETKTFTKDEIESFDISLSAESVSIEESADEKIVIEFYCDENTVPKTEIINKALKISEAEKFGFSFGGTRKTIIKLPKGYKPSDFDLNLSSGSIKINNLETANLDLHSSSGSVKINDSKIDALDLKTQSGSVKIENCEMDVAECSVTSGSINVNGKFNKMELHTVSGSINANLSSALTMDSEMKTTSGSIHANIPENSNLNINYSTTSGSYKNGTTNSSGKKGKDTMGSGSVKLELKTTSGSIRIN